ncbi:MAG: hypothetical protein EXR54_06110 [Dehalococcoidia bacterium]|nr:hypothetical protein [Dehalococcoidia bacterium]MSQ17129.1 hypothetical protein [Dehalococcoidia bacterium]
MRRSVFSNRAFVGLLLVALGVMFLLDNTRILGPEQRVWGTYWPVLLIAGGLWGLLASGFRGRLTPLVLLAVGVVFLLSNLRLWSFSVGQLWPVILVVVGLTFLLRRRAGASRPATANGAGKACYILGGGEERVTSQDYSSGEVTAICGGLKLDLRDAALHRSGDGQGKATLDVTIICGGLELLVPADWKVNLQTTTLLGGVENKQGDPAASTSRGELTITGTVLMGGIEVKDGVEVKDWGALMGRLQ